MSAADHSVDVRLVKQDRLWIVQSEDERLAGLCNPSEAALLLETAIVLNDACQGKKTDVTIQYSLNSAA